MKMKLSNSRLRISLQFFATILAGHAAYALPSHVRSVVGGWKANVHFKDGDLAGVNNLQILVVYNLGGTLTESSNYDEAPPVPPAYGIWRKVGPRRYEAKYLYFNTKAPKDFDQIGQGGGWDHSGLGSLKERITLSKDGNSYESEISFELIDANGKHLSASGHATGRGVRIKFQGPIRDLGLSGRQSRSEDGNAPPDLLVR